MNFSYQNTEKAIKLLSAQDRLYASAKTWTYLLFSVAILLPVGIAIGNKFYTETSNWMAIMGLVGLVIVFFINKHIKSCILHF